MKLISLNKNISLLILLILFKPLYAEEEIDIWNKEIKEKSEIIIPENNFQITQLTPKYRKKISNK